MLEMLESLGVEYVKQFRKCSSTVSSTGPQLLEGGGWERGGDFFQGGGGGSGHEKPI